MERLNKKRFDEHDYYYKLIFGICDYLGGKDTEFCKWITEEYCNQTKIKEFDSWFKSNKIKSGITYKTIEHWVKEDTGENYFIKANDVDDEYKVAEIIKKTLRRTLIYCNETWYAVNDENLWKIIKEPAFYITREFRKYCDQSVKMISSKITETENETEKDNLRKMNKKYGDAILNSSKTSFKANIIQFLKKVLIDNDFDKKLDVNVGKLAFKNGIMDLETREFTEGIKPDDLITSTIPHDYNKKFDEKKFDFLKNDVLKKILNNNPEHLEYFLSIIGYTFIGDPSLEKSLYFGIDKTNQSHGDNGKTFWFDILTSLMPNYVYNTNKSLLEADNKKVHKQLVNTKGKRAVWMDEFDEKRSNAEMIKNLANGLNIENEIMFGTTEGIRIMFKVFVLTNHIPNIDAKDTAVYNRFKQISYGSHFDRTGTRTKANPEKLQFIADTGLPKEIKTKYINEVFELIIAYAHKYYTDGIPKIPEQFLNDAKETQNKNDVLKMWFEENCEEDVGGKLSIQVMEENSKIVEEIHSRRNEKIGI